MSHLSPILDEMSWRKAEQYFARNDTVIFPVGCVHAHDHIPVGIDNLSALHLAHEVGKRTLTMVIPALQYGYMPQYMDYPGTLNLESATLLAVLSDINRCLLRWGVRRVVYMNGHGGNTPLLLEVGLKFRSHGMFSPILEWWKIASALDPALCRKVSGFPEGAEGGPGTTRGAETAAAMALGEHLVDPAETKVMYFNPVFPDIFGQDWFTAITFEGVSIPMAMWVRETVKEGEPGTCASREDGQQLLDKCVDFMCRFVEQFRRAKLPE